MVEFFGFFIFKFVGAIFLQAKLFNHQNQKSIVLTPRANKNLEINSQNYYQLSVKQPKFQLTIEVN